MKLFGKVFGAVFIIIIMAGALIAYLEIRNQISRERAHLLRENQMTCKFIAREIEEAYSESKWPFASLSRLAEQEGFLFWWIVREDGIIHLASRTDFIGTRASDYFPDLLAPKRGKDLIMAQKGKVGAIREPIPVGERKWLFVQGFSTRRLSEATARIITKALTFSLLVLAALGSGIYFIIERHLRPISELAAGAALLGQGHLDHRVKINSPDDLGWLAGSFNRMAENLKQTMVSKDYVDSIIAGMNEALLVVDPEYRVQTVNRTTCELLGYREDELLDQPVEKIFFAGGGLPSPGEQEGGTMREPFFTHLQTAFRAKDGRAIPILLNSSPITDSDGQVRWIVLTGMDITDRIKVENEREELIRELREALANIKTLRGLIPICAHCKKIRDDKGYWQQVETYLRQHSEVEFSHGLCPECMKAFFPGVEKGKNRDPIA